MSLDTEFYDSPYNQVTKIADRVCFVLRSGERFEQLAAIRAEYEAMLAVIERIRPLGLLLDLRAARGRNDPAFESALQPYRRRLLGQTTNTVILAGSAVGSLQIKRHMELDGLHHVRVVRDEAEARRLALHPAG